MPPASQRSSRTCTESPTGSARAVGPPAMSRCAPSWCAAARPPASRSAREATRAMARRPRPSREGRSPTCPTASRPPGPTSSLRRCPAPAGSTARTNRLHPGRISHRTIPYLSTAVSIDPGAPSVFPAEDRNSGVCLRVAPPSAAWYALTGTDGDGFEGSQESMSFCRSLVNWAELGPYVHVAMSQTSLAEAFAPEPITSVQPLRPTLRPTSRGKIIGRHSGMAGVLSTIERVARSSCTVLVSGESGTGKELVVAALHDASPRAGGRSSPSTAARSPRT